MSTLEELKKEWEQKSKTVSQPAYDEKAFDKIIKTRVKKHTNTSMKYFWASFALQILVYGLLSHVVVKYWSDPGKLMLSITGILLYIPFTVVLMKKFKAMATTKLTGSSDSSLQQYVNRYHDLLQSFYRFKKRYELFLIPVSATIGVWLVFELYVPGGVAAYPSGAIITLGVTLISCVLAIWSENKKSFEEPLRQLRLVLDEFRSES
ncbi:MAG TPA: hypothetical protein VFW11_19970 [Cyclobacteriaceae bacterium]|nr:hypothetical protein [Cyclobacteriaceae bacterium]